MPTLKYDRNATGTGTGGSWVNAISDPARLMNDQLSGGGGDTRRHEFAMGDNPWPATLNKTEDEGSARLEIVGVDPGNGSKQKPRFTCYQDAGTLSGWVEVNTNYIGYPNATNGGNASVVAQPGSKVWYRAAGAPARWAGSFRVSGELLWGRRCRLYKYAGDPGTPTAVVPSANYQYGTVASVDKQGVTRGPGGFVVYWDGGGDPSVLTFLNRPSGVTDTDVWTITRPVGGLELANLDFFENDFPINVENKTANSLIENVWIHHCSFRYSRKGFSPKGSGAPYKNGKLNGPNYRTGAGFKGLIFEHNIGYKLGQQLFHAWNSPAMDQSLVRWNRCRYNNMNEGSGTIYWDSSYTTDGSFYQTYGNWLDWPMYDGLYWLDGSGLYYEFGSANGEAWGNLITNAEVGAHLNIGQGTHRLHNNVMKGVAEANSEAAIRIVSADLETGDVSLGDAYIYANLVDRFGMFIGIIAFDYTGSPSTRTRFFVERNIARGRKSVDSNFLYPIQGSGTISSPFGDGSPNGNSFLNGQRMFLYRNNFTDFTDTTTSAKDNYGSGTARTDTTAVTSRLSATTIMDSIPTAPDSDGLGYNLALEAPTDIGTLNGVTPTLRAGKPTVMPA